MSLIDIAHPRALDEYLEASRDKYAACIDCIEPAIAVPGFNATMRLHHLRFDSNGVPKFDDLAKCLADHVIEYGYSARRRGRPERSHEYARLAREAKRLLRNFDTSGEAGELLLYFLMEAVLHAPQMVAKLDLKTSPKLEVNGSDGIHMKWHEADNVLDIYFGEAKLEESISNALDHAFASMESFHTDGLQDREFGLVTSHYKYADGPLKDAIIRYVDRQQSGGDCRVNHACLIGYDWSEYKKLPGSSLQALADEFRRRLEQDAPRLQELLLRRLTKFTRVQLRFEFFFLPFRTVQEFRDAFNSAIS